MSLNDKFAKAQIDVKKLKSRPTNDELLEIYALFKQATIGDCNTERPGLLNLKDKAKWDAWNGKKGVAADTAKEQYVAKVEALVASIGLQ